MTKLFKQLQSWFALFQLILRWLGVPVALGMLLWAWLVQGGDVV